MGSFTEPDTRNIPLKYALNESSSDVIYSFGILKYLLLSIIERSSSNSLFFSVIFNIYVKPLPSFFISYGYFWCYTVYIFINLNVLLATALLSIVILIFGVMVAAIRMIADSSDISSNLVVSSLDTSSFYCTCKAHIILTPLQYN